MQPNFNPNHKTFLHNKETFLMSVSVDTDTQMVQIQNAADGFRNFDLATAGLLLSRLKAFHEAIGEVIVKCEEAVTPVVPPVTP